MLVFPWQNTMDLSAGQRYLLLLWSVNVTAVAHAAVESEVCRPEGDTSWLLIIHVSGDHLAKSWREGYAWDSPKYQRLEWLVPSVALSFPPPWPSFCPQFEQLQWGIWVRTGKDSPSIGLDRRSLDDWVNPNMMSSWLSMSSQPHPTPPPQSPCLSQGLSTCAPRQSPTFIAPQSASLGLWLQCGF